MIARRSLMIAGLGLGTNLLLPPAASALAAAVPLEFDIIDLDIWTGPGVVPARTVIGPGAFLRADHCVPKGAAHRLTALLSPANAALLGEFLRFDRGVAIEERGANLRGLARAHARVVTVRWTRPLDQDPARWRAEA